MRDALHIGFLSVFLLFAGIKGQAQDFTYQNFLPTSVDVNFGTDLTPDGHIVGWYTDENAIIQSFTFKDGVTAKITVPQDRYAAVVAANARDYLAQGSFSGGYLISLSGTITDVQVPQTRTKPYGLNANGVIVGSYTKVNSGGIATSTGGFLF